MSFHQIYCLEMEAFIHKNSLGKICYCDIFVKQKRKGEENPGFPAIFTNCTLR